MASIEDIIASVECRQLVVDPFLKNAEFCRNRRGGLLRYTGGFTVVFPCIVNGEKWAFRCWHANVGDMQHRLKIVSESLERSSLSYFSEFRYIDNGIIIDGKACPTTRMKWIDGNDLKTYIMEHRDDRACLIRLATDFFSMTNELHKRSIAHGDLQHGNIIVDSRGGLHLIDYDSMYVSELESIAAADIIAGKPDYQHPSRSSNRFASKKLDYFSEAIILCSVLAMAYKPELAEKYSVEGSEGLLFTRADFESFSSSTIYRDLSGLPNCVLLLRDVIERYLAEDDINKLAPIDVAVQQMTSSSASFEQYISESENEYQDILRELEKRREQERIAEQKRQDDLAWAAACRWDAEDSYTAYLRNYPNGIHCIEAKNRIEKLKEERKEADEQLWKRSCFVNMSSAYSKYIKEYPAGTYISEAKKKYEECKDNEDWSRASSTNTLESYQKYLKNHPNGNFAGNAKVIILRLEAEKKEREEQRKKVAEQARIKAKKKAILKNIKTIFLCQIIPVCIIYGIYMVYSGKPSNNRANTYIQQPQKLEMNDYARSLESDIDKQLKSLEIAKQYNIGLDYNMKQKVGDKLEELSKYNSNKYKGYKERYDKL